MGINVNNNTDFNNAEVYKYKKGSPQKQLSSQIEVKSSMQALDAQGRALINKHKINISGYLKDNVYDELSEDTIDELRELSPEERKEFIDLYSEGNITADSGMYIVQIKDKEIKNFAIKLIKKGFNADVIEEINKGFCDPEYHGEAKEYITSHKENILKTFNILDEMLDKGYNDNDLSAVVTSNVEINEKNIKKMSMINNIMLNDPEFALSNALTISCGMEEILELKDDEFDNLISLINENIKNLDLIVKMVQDKEVYDKGKKLLKDGFNELDISYLIDKDEEEIEKLKNIMSKYSINAYNAIQLSDLDEDKIKKAIKFFEVTNEINHKVVNLPENLFDKTIDLISKGCDIDEVKKELSVQFMLGSDDKFSHYTNFLEQKEKEIDKKNSEFLQIVEKIENYNKYLSQLNKDDIKFLQENLTTNEFHTPSEYLKLFTYLRNLKTPKNENILGCESFMKKISKKGAGDIAIKEGDMLYSNINAILSIDPSSQNFNYIFKILSLIENGEINSSALRKISTLNDLNSVENLLLGINYGSKTESKWDISNNLKKDIDLMFDDGTNKENLNDKYIPSVKNNEEGLKSSEIGDAFVIEGEKFIRIKTNENESQIIKLSKETYAKLFPIVERFLTTQQTMGNCFCIETLMSMYCDDKTRAKLLQFMEEDEKGNITIKFENYTPVVFEKGKLPKNEDEEIYSNGADGYKLFEYAYSCALVEDKINEAKKELSGEKLNEFNDFINKNPNNFYIYRKNNEIKWMKYSEFKERNPESASIFSKKSYNTFNNYLLGNGGLQNDVYKKFGYNSSLYVGGIMIEKMSKNKIKKQFEAQGISCESISTLKKATKLIKNPNFLNNHQVQVGLGMHAYNLTKETDKNGNTKYYLYNPHNQGFPIKFDNLNDLMQKVTTITTTKID